MDKISSYFLEEKVSAFILIILGVMYVLSGLFFLCIIKYSLFKGLAIPLVLIGVLQCLAGSTIVSGSSNTIVRVRYLLTHEKEKINSEEIPRMKKVLQQMSVFKWVEVISIFTGLVLILRFHNSAQVFWKGVGLGLLLPFLILFILGFLAEKRAGLYLDFLLNLV
jgi:hypothetical protein